MLNTILPTTIALLLVWATIKLARKIIDDATGRDMDSDFNEMVTDAIHFEQKRIETLFRWLQSYPHTDSMRSVVEKAITEHEDELNRLLKMKGC